MMIDHQTYFSQLLMPVFPIEILSRVPSSSWPTWRGAATQCRSVQADFFPFPWGSPWISPWIFTDEHEIFQLDILHLHWWFIHWMFIGWFTIPWRMVYEKLDGLPLSLMNHWIGWFTQLFYPWFHHPLGGAVELSEDRSPYLNRAWKLGATKTLRNTLEVPQETN